jgi:branched-chain amino acid transport system permease protein
MTYAFHVLIFLEIYVILVLALNLIVGYCGMFSLAHSAYFAIGAYVYAVLTTAYGVGFAPALLAAVAMGAALSVLLSLPSWRLRGDFFLLITLAAQAVIFSSIYNWGDITLQLGSLPNLTNGPYGIGGVPGPRFFSDVLAPVEQIAVVGFACVCAVVWTLRLLDRSAWGRMLRAMRDDELALRNLGKNVRVVKAQALALACATATIGGVIYAAYAGYVDPAICSVEDSVLLLGAVVIGGPGTVRGAVVGATLVVMIPEVFRALDLPATAAANIRLGLFGLLMVLLVHFRPSGLMGRVAVE